MVVCVNILDEKTKRVLIDKIIIKWNQKKCDGGGGGGVRLRMS